MLHSKFSSEDVENSESLYSSCSSENSSSDLSVSEFSSSFSESSSSESSLEVFDVLEEHVELV